MKLISSFLVFTIALLFIACRYCVAQENYNVTSNKNIISNNNSANSTTLQQGSNIVTMYVAPRNELPVRTGEGFQYRIIAILKDGTKVTLLKTDGNWAYIRLQNGKQGWVLKRYLSKEIPLRQQIIQLKKQNLELSTKLLNAQKSLSDLQNKLNITLTQNKNLKNKLDYISTLYKQLKHDAANVISLRKAYEASQKALQQAKQQIVVLETQNSRLRNSDRIKWFLAGAAVLLIGWLIGLIMGKGRKRRSSLTI